MNIGVFRHPVVLDQLYMYHICMHSDTILVLSVALDGHHCQARLHIAVISIISSNFKFPFSQLLFLLIEVCNRDLCILFNLFIYCINSVSRLPE